jgi:nitroimidazol reductase NimA-like FMN-containing flavoprotein (pyridoxamine 5'-phosphate oxidase superfamily)
MPEYGVDAGDEGLLPWSWAVERLERSRSYWLATVRADGRPHTMPVWAVWLDDALLFSTGAKSRKARNLAHSPHCVATTERADEAVIVEGRARLESHEPTLARLRALYQTKYGMGYPPDSAVYSVRPRVVFGFIDSTETFAKTATRWRFPD